MARQKGPSASYYCAICRGAFPGRKELSEHTMTCEAGPNTYICAMCNWPFPDSLALEEHQRTSDHGLQVLVCPTCKQCFTTSRALSNHNKQRGACDSPSLFTCSACLQAFSEEREHRAHIQFPNPCSDAFRNTPPKAERIGHVYYNIATPAQVPVVLVAVSDAAFEADSDSDMPSNLTDGNEWCHRCKSSFRSMALLVAHEFRCITFNSAPDTGGAVQAADQHSTPVVDGQLPQLHTKSVSASRHASPSTPPSAPPPTLTQCTNTRVHDPVLTVTTNLTAHLARQAPPQGVRLQPTPSAITTSAEALSFPLLCGIQGCSKSFRSEAGLKVHKTDAHGIGGKGLDVTGKDSWMLGQRAREDLRKMGQLQSPQPQGSSSSFRGRSRGRPASGRSPVPPVPAPQVQQPVHRGPAPMNYLLPPTAITPSRQAPAHVPIHLMPVVNVATAVLNCGPLEFDQAEKLRGKVLRLLIPADIFIRHDGNLEVCGLLWTRIGVLKQVDVPGMLDNMCHLPRVLQSDNYVPAPKTFVDECNIVDCNVNDFQESPPRDRAKPSLDVVALSCAKVVLADGRKEVVKIAAVDVPSGRTLMSYLVCTDGAARVSDWRTPETGIVDWKDMEQARDHGYKVFKGWAAARLALRKFVDNETILVGHIVRADLDALRMTHGRAVDIAILAEKAAKGPLSKSQLRIDNLCRDFLNVHLTTDPQFGRDALMDAYACRGLALWIVKNGEELGKVMRKKSADYQKIM